jgi:hypothetical protein
MKNLSLPLDKPIAFFPKLSRILGGIEEAIYFQQLYYWYTKTKGKEWFYKTKEEIEEETTIRWKKQDKIRKKLEKMGWIQTKRAKVNGSPVLHYKLDIGICQLGILEPPQKGYSNIPIREVPTLDTENTNREKKYKKKISKKSDHVFVVEYFFKLKGWEDSQNIVFARYVKSASDLLTVAGSVEKAKESIDKLKKWADEIGLNWNLNTVIKKWNELDDLEKKPEAKKRWYIENDQAYQKNDRWYVINHEGDHKEWIGSLETLRYE